MFERGLDPGKRAQLGAHYTDRDKIMLLVEPVVRRNPPYRRRFGLEKSCNTGSRCNTVGRLAALYATNGGRAIPQHGSLKAISYE